MNRTTILLPENLKRKVNLKAKIQKLSLGEYIRKSLESSLKMGFDDLKNDPFINDKNIFIDKVETDISLRHDDYIYGEE